MIFGLFTLAVALAISAVAAYYSIAGLCAIFSAAVVPVIIMGAALEVGKIVATVWLQKFWHRCALQFKLYLIPAIIILMIITSMGIFGYLSKAHMDQSVTVGDSSAQVSILDEKIKTEQDNISANKKALQQMDAQVDQLLGRTIDDRGANRAVQVRKQQAKERKSLQADISASQQRIATLQNERAPLAAQSRKIEAEVGPIKYIAALIYGDNPDANLLERAVRWVIILLVLVFDPLALVLILAAEQTIDWAREDKKKKPNYELDDGPLTDEQLDKIKQEADVDDDIEMTKFFEDGKELAKTIDANNGYLPDDYAKTQSYLNTPWTWIPKQEEPAKHEDPLDIPVLEGEEMWAQEAIDSADTTKQDLENAIGLIAEMQAKIDALQAEVDAEREEIATIKSVDPVTLTDHLGNPIATYYPPVTAPDLSINAEMSGNSVSAGFGTSFPKSPNKGDLYLRVDYLPSKLYKWNEAKWIEVDKATTDVYSYDTEYIKHLTDKIASGEYDVDLLTQAEQEQIQQYIKP